MTRPCSVAGCQSTHYARGLCLRHYHRLRNGTPLDAPPKPPPRTGCLIEGCARPHEARGYCKYHYEKLARPGRECATPATPPKPMPALPKQTCAVSGCAAQVRAKGLCNAHYHRMRDGRLVEPLRVTQSQLTRVTRYAQELLADAFTDYAPLHAWRRACLAQGIPPNLLPMPDALNAVARDSRARLLTDAAARRDGARRHA